ncbi:hypothetical protein VTN31DRAFT_3748 [Thermomyces dupontii]|uniref:uncharacterized protein n=1 Tax=Talaromyces thermophilus TaxID=28565 RepID=UPI0037448DE3
MEGERRDSSSTRGLHAQFPAWFGTRRPATLTGDPRPSRHDGRRLGLRFFCRGKDARSPDFESATIDQAAARTGPPPSRSGSDASRRPLVYGWIRPGRQRRLSSSSGTPYRNVLKHRLVRKHLVMCAISALLLLTVLLIYLGFSVSQHAYGGREYHILLILLILIFSIFFCHSLARTIMVAARLARHGHSLHRVPSVVGPLGYAQPERPIHVILARDEELLDENRDNHPKSPPPAYGLWRASVRINPDLLYWQRVEPGPSKPPENADSRDRPPSYTSDDGVQYVIHAQPRSIAPSSSDFNARYA